MATSEKAREVLERIPKPAIWTTGVLAVGAVVGGSALFGGAFLIFLLALVILAGLCVGAYFLWRAWARKRHSGRLDDDLRQHTAASPRDIRDPGKRARLDDLRGKFEEGIKEYASRGKDLYRLPWYVFVGPPGSGKTEAIRHCNVGFPQGMHDCFQGVGGTINMHWWFTNHAVILDTAGKLMFEEVKPGEASEWREFLKLLKRHRNRCPVNGLFLTIGVDSLIKESADEIAQKAGRIAQQLDVIQRVLDVRFPVYVIVTKCDLLSGFREYFDGLTDPQLQHQMVGWSNPDKLDTPFKPEEVTRYLNGIIEKLKKYRLSLLQDCAPREAERRIDEVDALFSLPQSFSLIGPRLRRYLETIFVAGEWSPKPLFLRGIYFTSAMQEGSELDLALAQTLGVKVDELPEGKAWKRERAYFLRDLFMEKAFRERGLVTRATNTTGLVRRRNLAFYGCGFLFLALFLLLTGFGMRELERSVKSESELWSESQGNVSGKPIKEVVFEIGGTENFGYNPKVVELNSRLRDTVQRPFKVSPLFKPIAWSASVSDEKRRKAQRLVFEESVLRPLLTSARARMVREGRNLPPDRHAAALRSLIWVESIVAQAQTAKAWEWRPREWDTNFFGPLLRFVGPETEPAESIDAATTNLSATLAWTYSAGGDPSVRWPPAFLSGGTNLAANTAIQQAMKRFLGETTQSVSNLTATIAQLKLVLGSARKFDDGERAVRDFAGRAGRWTEGLTLYQRLDDARQELTARLTQASGRPDPGDYSMLKAYEDYRKSGEASVGSQMRTVQLALDDAVREAPGLPLFREISNQLHTVQISLSREFEASLSAADLDAARRYDTELLASQAYARRWTQYAKARDLIQTGVDPATRGGLDAWLRTAERFKDELGSYRGPVPESTNACHYLVDRAFLVRAGREVVSRVAFPLTRYNDSVTTNRLSLEQVGDLTRDAGMLAAFVTNRLELPLGDDLRKLADVLGAITRAGTLLLAPDDQAIRCKVLLPTEQATSWRNTYRTVGLTVGSRRPRIRADSGGLLGEVGLGDALTIELLDLDARNVLLSLAVPDWAPLELARSEDKDAAVTSRKIVPVKLPLNQFQGGQQADPGWVLQLQLEFTPALPDLEKWPSTSDLRALRQALERQIDTAP